MPLAEDPLGLSPLRACVCGPAIGELSFLSLVPPAKYDGEGSEGQAVLPDPTHSLTQSD